MASDLTPQNEQFIEQALAQGLFPSREALLNSAVDGLRGEAREWNAANPSAEQLAEELRLVDDAIDESEAGLGREYTEADWSDLLERALRKARSEKKAAS